MVGKSYRGTRVLQVPFIAPEGIPLRPFLPSPTYFYEVLAGRGRFEAFSRRGSPIQIGGSLHCRHPSVTQRKESPILILVIGLPTPHHPPAAVQRALRKLGTDIHDARRRRRLPMAVVADRAFTSRSTLQRIEAGDTSVSIGIYAAVLQALGLLDGLSQVADLSNDIVGQTLASSELPKHIHLKRKTGPSTHG